MTGAIAALASGSSKNKGVSVAADPYGDTRNKFLQWLSGDPQNPKDMGQIGKPGPVYGGEYTAPASSQENASLDKVNQYANQGLSDTFKAGQGEIQKTLSGNYDPSTSPYYQAVKAKSAQNLADTKNQIASDAAGGGRYFTGSRIKQQARATSDSNMNLDNILGQLSLQERQNRLSVLPQAMAYGQAEQNLPLQQATALQSLGALPRTLQQNTDNAMLENFYKSQYDYPLSIASLAQGTQTPPTYQQNTNPLQQLLGQGASTAMQLLPLLMMSGGCWVAAQVFGGWNEPKTLLARFYVNCIAPGWFKALYLKHGERLALIIERNFLLKSIIRPIFENFSHKAALYLRFGGA